MSDDVQKVLSPQSSASRRKFLRLAGIGVAAGLAGCAQPTPVVKEVIKEVPKEVIKEVVKEVPKEVVKEVVKEVPKLPWQYVQLDVETARKLGHQGYYDMECSAGALYAVVKQLQDKVGFPFTQMQPAALRFGQGGVAGWGTTCGALLGAATAITLVLDYEKDAKKLIDELLTWYSKTPFPSEVSNQYAVNHEFLVKEYKSDKKLASSVSDSPLCHVSVSGWCEAAQMASGSKERSERCGRLTGDVAARTVELLNAQLVGNFKATSKLSDEAKACTTCHTKGEDFNIGNVTQGKGECLDCHDDHRTTPVKK